MPSKPSVQKKLRVTGTCISILSWGMAVWVFQFWLALLGVIALGALGALDSITSNLVGDFIVRGVDGAFELFTIAASVVLGADVTTDLLDSLEVLLILGVFGTWLIGLVTLFAMAFQLTFAGCRPFSGEAITAKNMAVLAALIGYLIPILNFFPWFIFWVFAVWKNPR